MPVFWPSGRDAAADDTGDATSLEHSVVGRRADTAVRIRNRYGRLMPQSNYRGPLCDHPHKGCREILEDVLFAVLAVIEHVYSAKQPRVGEDAPEDLHAKGALPQGRIVVDQLGQDVHRICALGRQDGHVAAEERKQYPGEPNSCGKFGFPERLLTMKGIRRVRSTCTCSGWEEKMPAWLVRTDSISSRPKGWDRPETRSTPDAVTRSRADIVEDAVGIQGRGFERDGAV